MTVGIDVTASKFNAAGTKRYIDGLLSGLAQLGATHMTPLSAPEWATRSSSNRVKSKAATLYRDLWWPHVVLPSRVKAAGVDVLHLPANVGLLRCPCPMVVTMFDTTVFEQGQHHKRWHRAVTRFGMSIAAREAAVILTISEYSKQRISAVLAVEPSRIAVTYCGYDAKFRRFPDAERHQAERELALGDFILTVGTLEPRKNLGTLLEAFASLRRSGYRGALVHAGPRGWKSENVDRQIADLGLSGHVRFLGYVDDVTLVRLYNLASVFVFPSLTEGFGLPVLEAMACGTPVVSACGSSLEEVGGQAARFIDPQDADDLADALRTVLDDPGLRDTMVRAGLARAGQFSWRACAELTVQAYQRAAR